MGAFRKSRAERVAAPAGSRCTERDLRLLQAVGRMKVATTEQLANLFFTSERTASRRLRVLVGMKFLDVRVFALHEPNHYTLTERAVVLLVEQGRDPSTLHRGWKGLRREDLPHLRAINDLRVALVMGAKAIAGVQLVRFLADHDVRRTLGAGPQTKGAYVPDALVELQTPSGVLRMVVEMDRATQGAQRFAATKGQALAQLARAKAPCFGLEFPWCPVVFAPTEQRVTRLLDALAQVSMEPMWRGALLLALTPSSVYSGPYRARTRANAGERVGALLESWAIKPSVAA